MDKLYHIVKWRSTFRCKRFMTDVAAIVEIMTIGRWGFTLGAPGRSGHAFGRRTAALRTTPAITRAVANFPPAPTQASTAQHNSQVNGPLPPAGSQCTCHAGAATNHIYVYIFSISCKYDTGAATCRLCPVWPACTAPCRTASDATLAASVKSPARKDISPCHHPHDIIYIIDIGHASVVCSRIAHSALTVAVHPRHLAGQRPHMRKSGHATDCRMARYSYWQS